MPSICDAMRSSCDILEIDVKVHFDDSRSFVFVLILFFGSVEFAHHAKALSDKTVNAKTLVFITKSE